MVMWMRRNDSSCHSRWLELVCWVERFAGRAAVDCLLWRRARRRCLPVAPVLLAKVAPVLGTGSGAKDTAFLTLCNLRDVSVLA